MNTVTYQGQTIDLMTDVGGWAPHVTTMRPWQTKAVQEALDAYDDGIQYVFLNAPTGSGKTNIAEAIRRVLGARAAYVATDKALQAQALEEFEQFGAHMLQGKSNYPVGGKLSAGFQLTAADCDATKKLPCSLCPNMDTCPYRVARAEALASDLAILNTALLLNMFRPNIQLFTGRDLYIVDEADRLPEVVSEFAGTKMSKSAMDRAGVEWEALEELTHVGGGGVSRREAKRNSAAFRTWAKGSYRALQQEAQVVLNEGKGLTGDERLKVIKRAKRINESAAGLRWIADSDDSVVWTVEEAMDGKGFEVRPIQSGLVTWPVFTKVIGDSKVLFMSGSMKSRRVAQDLGIGKEAWVEVNVPSQFPIEHRPVVIWPGMKKMTGRRDPLPPDVNLAALTRVLEEHDERVLIHVTSHRTARALRQEFEDRGREIYTHGPEDPWPRGDVINMWLDDPTGVLITPSGERGLDLKGDLCRTQVIVKCTIPMWGPGSVYNKTKQAFEGWFMDESTAQVETQRFGRVCRSTTDYGVTYVLDPKMLELNGKLPDFVEEAFTNENPELFDKYPGKIVRP